MSQKGGSVWIGTVGWGWFRKREEGVFWLVMYERKRDAIGNGYGTRVWDGVLLSRAQWLCRHDGGVMPNRD